MLSRLFFSAENFCATFNIVVFIMFPGRMPEFVFLYFFGFLVKLIHDVVREEFAQCFL